MINNKADIGLFSNIITEDVLDCNPNYIFVFGDNLKRTGKGGAAALRYHPQSHGFITKKYPSNHASSFYKPEEYKPVFDYELNKLITFMDNNKDRIYLISKLGSGLANKYNIWKKVIEPGLEELKQYPNVVFLF